MMATVLKSTGNIYDVQFENKRIKARLRGRFKKDNIRATNPVAVGDKVEIEQVDDDFVIVDILPRQNYLIRKSVNLSKQYHIIASNIDLACIVFTFRQPQTSLGFLDRFLVTCEAYHIQPIIVCTKNDLWGEEEHQEFETLSAIYTQIGYTVLSLSVYDTNSLNALIQLLQDKTSLFFGHSGAGKSSLVNALDSHIDLKVGSISTIHQKGKHTTTFAEMHPWQFGGNIIDTPGIKEFGLFDFDAQEIDQYFPEIFEYASACKFHNCSHISEPKCAVKEAVENNEIAFSRYESYMKFREECLNE